MQDSVFAKIIRGELPSHKVYENEGALAIMDIYPTQAGHVVVIAKKQIENFYELPNNDAELFWQAVQDVAKKLAKVFPAKKRIAVQVEVLQVPHAHAHLFPFDTHEQYHAGNSTSEADQEELARLAERIRNA